MTFTSARIPERATPRGLGKVFVVGLLTMAGCGKPFRAEKLVALTAPLPIRRLEIRSRMGEIEVNADSVCALVRADAFLVGHGSSQRDANEALDEIEVELTPQSGGTVVAEGHHPRETSWRGYEIRWKLTAPPG